MRKLILALAGAAIITSTTAQAAEDSGLRLHSFRGAGTQSALGAQLGMTLKLDSKRVVRDSERVQIGFSAGPVLAVQDARTGAVRHGQTQLAGFTLRPGYSASVTLAGRPIATGYTTLGAVEKDAETSGDKPRKKSRTVRTVLLVAGGIAVAVGVGFLVLVASIDNDGE
jgi:hypothetical protein